MNNLHGRCLERCHRPARVAAALLLAFLLAPASPAPAQQGPGVRAGVGADPDQFYVGGHYVTAPLVEGLRFQPNVEAGFGDEVTLVAVNFEFGYWFRLDREWQLYVGGGPAMNLYDSDRRDDTDVEPGVNLLAGLRLRKGLFFEFKVGVLDSPDVKFGVGYTF